MFDDFPRENRLENPPKIRYDKSTLSLEQNERDRFMVLAEGDTIVFDVRNEHLRATYRFSAHIKEIKNRFSQSPAVVVNIREDIEDRDVATRILYANGTEDEQVKVTIGDESTEDGFIDPFGSSTSFNLFRLEGVDLDKKQVTIEVAV